MAVSQTKAAERLAAAMHEYASDVHIAALLDALVGCAKAVDESPGVASLWKEYRALLESVREAGGRQVEVDRRLVEFMSIDGVG